MWGWLRRLRGGDTTPRTRATAKPGESENTHSISRLVGVLHESGSWRSAEREKAVASLEQIGGAAALEAIRAALRDEDYDVQRSAIDALDRAHDTRYLSDFSGMLGCGKLGNGYAAQEAMLKHGSLAVGAFLEALRSGNTTARTRAVEALGRLKVKDPEAVDALLQALRADPSNSTREAAAEALAETDDPRVQVALTQALRDPDCRVRATVAATLAALGWKPTDDSDRAWQAVAAREWDAALSCGSAAFEPLLVALKDRSSYVIMAAGVRRDAAAAFGRQRDERSIEALADALDDPEAEVRVAAAEALQRFDSTSFGERAAAIDAKVAAAIANRPKTLESLVGQAVDIPGGWCGLPWTVDPSQSRVEESDWVTLSPGTYVVAKVEPRWVYVRRGSVMVKLDAGDVAPHFLR